VLGFNELGTEAAIWLSLQLAAVAGMALTVTVLEP